MHQTQNMDPDQQYWAEGDSTESNIGVFKTGEKLSFWELFKKHKVSVMVDCLVFGIFGMGVAFLGPTLFDLGCQTNSDLKKMNWVFFVQLLMTMIGSISAGYLTGRYVYYNIFLYSDTVLVQCWICRNALAMGLHCYCNICILQSV